MFPNGYCSGVLQQSSHLSGKGLTASRMEIGAFMEEESMMWCLR